MVHIRFFEGAVVFTFILVIINRGWERIKKVFTLNPHWFSSFNNLSVGVNNSSFCLHIKCLKIPLHLSRWENQIFAKVVKVKIIMSSSTFNIWSTKIGGQRYININLLKFITIGDTEEFSHLGKRMKFWYNMGKLSTCWR